MADTPIPVGVGALALTGAAPTIAASNLTIQGNIVLHLYTLEAALDQGLTLPMMSVEATGLVGHITNVFQIPLDLPLFEVESTILAGRTVSGDVTLPMIELYASNGSVGAVTLPLLEVTASGVSGGLVTSDVTLPLIEVAAVGQHTESAVDIDMPLFVVTSTALHGSKASADITMPMITAVATVAGGKTIVAALTLPMLEVSGSLYGEVDGTADLQLPIYKLNAEMYSAFAETFRGYVMNVETEAVSTYSAYNFNSFAKIGDSYFGASADGIFELTGDTDNGTAIDAVATFKADNFGNSREARVVGAYVTADLADDMRISLTANGNTYVYEIAANGARGLVNRRIDTVKGEKAIYWQASIMNVGGADFRLTDIEILAKKLARRV